MPAVLLVCALFLLVAAPAAPAAAPKGWLGVNVDGPMTDGRAPATEWDVLAGTGAGLVRASFAWSEIEPARGAYEFSRPDAIVAAAAARGVPVLPVVHATPPWAAARDGDAASPPRDPADYARLLGALIGRYGVRGSLWTEHPELRRTPIRAWQVWNEPNIARSWSVQPFARGYVRLLRASHRAVRAADRGATVVLAGLPNRSWSDLRSIYRAGGRGHFDAVALHPYTRTPANVVRIAELVRGVMRRHRDAATPLWLTELSWPASRGKVRGARGFETSDRGQALRLRGALRLLERARRRLRIARVVWYTWLSADAGSPNPFDYSGLRRLRDGTIAGAPALAEFRRVARR